MITILTQAGVNLLTEVVGAEGQLEFVKAEFGSGQWTTGDEKTLNEEIKNATALRNRQEELDMYFDVGEGSAVDGHIILNPDNQLVELTTEFNNSRIEQSFHLTEVGYYAQNSAAETPTPVLFAVSATDWSTAAYIPAANEQVATFTDKWYVYVGDVAQVSALINEANDTASGTAFNAHVNDFENPHNTTKQHVGLGDVPNVPTNEQAPTFTMAGTLENIDGSVNEYDERWEPGDAPRGKETLSVLFGKIKKAIDTLISHVNKVGDKNLAQNNGNPHGTTAADVGAASKKHYHNLSTDVDGVLKIDHGGTGHPKKAEFDSTSPRKNSEDCVVQYGTSYSQGDDKSVVMHQWGWLNCESNQITVTFKHPYPDERYSLTFPTCGRRIIPIWRLESQTRTGFTLSRYFGISAEPLKKMLRAITAPLRYLLSDSQKAELDDIINNRIGASQAADWHTIGKAGK